MKDHRPTTGLSDDLDRQSERNDQLSIADLDPRSRSTVAFPIRLNASRHIDYDPLQWILYRWYGERWYPRSYCCTATGLQLSVRELVGPVDNAASVALQNLPSWHPDRSEVRP